MSAPPSNPGALHVSVAWPAPGAALSEVGGSGVVRGVPLAGSLGAPGPNVFTARTWNWYAVPFVNPVTVASRSVDGPSGNVVHVVPSVETDPTVVRDLVDFSDRVLGKGVVVCRDTPNFVANRIGVAATLLGFRATFEGGYTVEEVDLLNGPLVGRPRTGSFSRSSTTLGWSRTLTSTSFVPRWSFPSDCTIRALSSAEASASGETPICRRKLAS